MKEGNNNNKIKFSPYWVYAVIITILLGMSMFGGDSSWQSIKNNISDFERFSTGRCRRNHCRQSKLAKVTFNSYGLEKSIHKNVNPNILGQENTGAHTTNSKWGI